MKKSVFIIATIVAVLILSACGPGKLDPTLEAYEQQMLGTVVAQTITAEAPTATFTSTVTVAPTATLVPSVTPTLAPTQTLTATVAQGDTCDQAKLISEDPQDGTVYTTLTTFTKEWTLMNVGNCTWTTNFKVIFAGGDEMGFQGPVNLPNNVAPNEEVTISVRLVAPSPIGTHVGSFLLQNDTGGHFGLGSNKTPFTVQVITTNYHKEPTPTKKH